VGKKARVKLSKIYHFVKLCKHHLGDVRALITQQFHSAQRPRLKHCAMWISTEVDQWAVWLVCVKQKDPVTWLFSAEFAEHLILLSERPAKTSVHSLYCSTGGWRGGLPEPVRPRTQDPASKESCLGHKLAGRSAFGWRKERGTWEGRLTTAA
jgi:hypothetical protein